ncbi:MAG: hypothetical protein ACTHJ5_05330 [Ilyomonas sp.]
MKKILMIIGTSLLFAACGNQNNAGVQNEPPAGTTPDTQAVAQPDSAYNMRDSVPNKMYDTGKGNARTDTASSSRGQ